MAIGENQTAEQRARDNIDDMLRESGWAVQDKSKINLNAGYGQAVREYSTDKGPADYVLFVDRRPVGVIEAKAENKAENLSVVEEQTAKYAKAQLKHIQNEEPLPFLYESTGVITRFTDLRDPKPRAREVFSFHRPETLLERLSLGSSLRDRLQKIPHLNPKKLPAKVLRLRDCQERAITNLEHSFQENRPRALIQMATGSGKTYTAITFIYRLLKYARAKRILFLVDTKNLGEQAEQEFMGYVPLDDNRKFTELYTVQRLKSSHVATDSQVCISTIQRMYSILKGEELDESWEEENPAEQGHRRREPTPVDYNPKVPIEFFDFIVIDECHRSIYNLWRQVLDYFDAFQIGLTATPDNRAFGYFHQNIVSEYTHEQAVVDGVNVGSEVYLIETKVSQEGASLKEFQQVEKRERLTRARRWEFQDEDEKYTASQLDRDVVNPSQIRTVLQAFKDNLPAIFPQREEVPKTLIFAKSDSHADDIIQITRQIFGEGNNFCKKVTYRTNEDPKSVLNQFRNEYYPRIAVTVDMIATGTDVKPLECLLFMRDVRSSNYFEQMKGRGTRTLEHDDLRKVTPSAASAKTHFVVVDAVGVTRSKKNTSPPLVTKPSIPLKELAREVMFGHTDSDTVSTLAGRLARLDRQLTEEQQQELAKKMDQQRLNVLVRQLLDAIDADKVEEKAKELAGNSADSTRPIAEEQLKKAQDFLVKEASKSITGELIETIENIRRRNEQTVDHDNPDEIIGIGWDADAHENASKLINDFTEYLRQNCDELEALSIYFNQPQRRREVTFEMLSSVLMRLQNDVPRLSPDRVYQAYALLDKIDGKTPLKELTALVSVIRRICGLDNKIRPADEAVRQNFKRWIFKRHEGNGDKFTEEQMDWLRMILDHFSTNFHFEQDDLEYVPFNGQGGLGRMYQLFGEKMEEVLTEINEELAA